VSLDFALFEPGQRVSSQELSLAASQALEQAANSGRGQLWLQRWEAAP
jgi:hypothetical protein